MNTVSVTAPYGPLKPRMQYPVQDTGYDWVRVKHGGGLIYVPINALASQWEQERLEREARRAEEREEEEEYGDYEDRY